ncbi:glycine betaine ABC transporter substrate-binding protein [Rubrobacter aplysinae]|uniref:glycine betaine ABC transporter substrate-binding protein n=1 Tax=Rubrobacter aplysinae TaxID=909625 RepID=UPI00064B8E37|nr:glycine betaine ABC transporter substrate-binding protein [Rubrobacter aplysinae]
MFKRKKLTVKTLALALVASLVLAGCGGVVGGGSSASGPISDVDLSGADLTVGSKDFTEQLILGYIAVKSLESTGASVTDQVGLASTNAARSALVNGDIDMYWEYTGTNYITHLGNTDPPDDSQKLFDTVQETELQENDIRLLEPPAPMNNTYALAVRQEVYNEDSDQYDEDLAQMEKLSDIGQLIEENPDKATVCVDSEFAARDDGLPGMEKEYGYEFPKGNISRFQEGVIYDRADEGDPCNFGEVFTSDGRVAALNLKPLEDDEGFFPLYNPTINVREEVYQENKALSDLFEPISEEITLKTMQELNARVDVDGEDPEDVAEDWLTEQGFIE